MDSRLTTADMTACGAAAAVHGFRRCSIVVGWRRFRAVLKAVWEGLAVLSSLVHLDCKEGQRGCENCRRGQSVSRRSKD